jgi:hypothetical protein
MARGLSIHIGLNGVDPNAYGGWSGTLAGCVNDAQAMQKIAKAMGYQDRCILNQQATTANVVAAITQAAGMLQSGDILLLTYSGHGGQTPDPTHTEATGMNSTWVLYDRQVVDDELYALWAKFQPQVRIFVLSDSCHSGTVTREVQYSSALSGNEHLARDYGTSRANVVRFRNMPLDVNQKDYRQRRLMYDTIATYTPKDVDVKASVLLISGCQDNQLSADGTTNGLFTEKLLQVWSNGGFKGTYSAFRDKIVSLMPPTQCPNYYVVGTPSPAFEGQNPFAVSAVGTQTQQGGAQQGGTASQQSGAGGAQGGAGGAQGGVGESGGSWAGDGGTQGSGQAGGDTTQGSDQSDTGSGTDTGTDQGGDSGWGTDTGTDQGGDSGWGTDSGSDQGGDSSWSDSTGSDQGGGSGWTDSGSGDSGSGDQGDSGWTDSSSQGDNGWSDSSSSNDWADANA